MGNFDRPLTKSDWAEMAIDKQWVTLEVMGFLKEEKPESNPTDSMAATINMTPDSPASENPPPPKSTEEVQTYSADRPTGVWHYLRDAERGKRIPKEKSPKGEDPKGKWPKRKSYEEKDAQGKDRKGKIDAGKEEDLEEGGDEPSQRVKDAVFHYSPNTHGCRIWHRRGRWMNDIIESTSARWAVGSIGMEHGATREIQRMQKS